MGHERNLCLRVPPFSDVFMGRNPPAVWHRLMNDSNCAAIAEIIDPDRSLV